MGGLGAGMRYAPPLVWVVANVGTCMLVSVGSCEHLLRLLACVALQWFCTSESTPAPNVASIIGLQLRLLGLPPRLDRPRRTSVLRSTRLATQVVSCRSSQTFLSTCAATKARCCPGSHSALPPSLIGIGASSGEGLLVAIRTFG